MVLYRNELIQVVGDIDAGKTKFILNYIRNFQMQNNSNIVLYSDIDQDLVYRYLEQNKIDDSRFFYNNGISFLFDILDSNSSFGLIVIDSLPMVGKSMDIELFIQNLRRAVDSQQDLTIMYTNQYRHKLVIDNTILYPWYFNVISKYTDRHLVVSDGCVHQEYKNNNVKHLKNSTENVFSGLDSKILTIAQNINEKAVFVCK